MNKKYPLNRIFVADRIFAFFERKSPSDKLILKTVTLTLLVTVVMGLINVSYSFMETVPVSGGVLVEGIVGTPRFVNPVLATSRADRDISALVYGGLMRLDKTGSLAPYLAKSVDISNDGTIYDIVLKSNITFHDGTPITADDVVFTFNLIKDSIVKSPLESNFRGVTVEKRGDYELYFVLETAFSPFIENLTFGIMPEHIWSQVDIDEIPFNNNNVEPIGSGPYRVKKVVRDDYGLIESYQLVAYEGATAQPKIEQIVLNFFNHETELIEALNQKDVMAAGGLSPASLAKLKPELELTAYRQPLPRTFAIFFNQNKSVVLQDKTVREALNAVIDREVLVSEVLSGYGIPIASPIPPGFGVLSTPLNPAEDVNPEDILLYGGWEQAEDGTWFKEGEDEDEKIELKVDIVTADSEVLTTTANLIEKAWRELGVKVSVTLLEQADLTKLAIEPRDYEAFLFGIDIGRQLDFYPFWHSGGRNHPGLNIALYTSIATDKLLTDLRTEKDNQIRLDYYREFEAELTNDLPAIWLYVPEFTYVLPKSVHIQNLEGLSSANDRFAGIANWYLENQNLWPIFNAN